jgi:phage baseplate assembly protein gpV
MIRWTTKAFSLRRPIGANVTVGCPAGGTQATVWGTGAYTDDSSICTAAVHAGFITLARGGIVSLEITAGRAAYPGTPQNGVTSANWGQWRGSFVFVGSSRPLPPGPRRRVGSLSSIPWNKTARHLRPQVGKQFTFRCPASGRLFTVWGSSIYTDDSSICSAAVHAGYITLSRGGLVTLEIQSGQSAYQGSGRHGVKSASWRNWTGSFLFVVPTVAPRSP